MFVSNSPPTWANITQRMTYHIHAVTSLRQAYGESRVRSSQVPELHNHNSASQLIYTYTYVIHTYIDTYTQFKWAFELDWVDVEVTAHITCLDGLVPAACDGHLVVWRLNPAHTFDGGSMLGKCDGLVGLKVPNLAGFVTGGSQDFSSILEMTIMELWERGGKIRRNGCKAANKESQRLDN